MNEADVAIVPAAPKVAEPVPATEAQVNDEVAASKVDEKLEQEVNGDTEQPKAGPQTNGTPAQEEEEPELQAPVPAVDAELVKDEEVPTPEPTPVAEQQEPSAEKEEPTPTPSLPKTWANIASKTRASAPVVPAIPAAAPKATASATQPASQTTVQPAPASTPAPAAAAAPAPTPAPPVTETRAQDNASNDGSGWQTAGADHKKTQSRAGEEQTVHGYIKNVTDKIDVNQLKQTLSRFGKLKYFDINRAKVCPNVSPGGILAC